MGFHSKVHDLQIVKPIIFDTLGRGKRVWSVGRKFKAQVKPYVVEKANGDNTEYIEVADLIIIDDGKPLVRMEALPCNHFMFVEAEEG
jgi:hypothetical protein